jgi:hypothetical protein
MSSFIVRPETINRIVSYLSLAQSSGRIEHSGVQYVLKEHGIHVEAYRDKEALVKALLALNMQAVNERYGDTSLSTMPGKIGMKENDYRFQYEDGGPIRVYKSLRCLVYQCSEGNVPETPLFKFLEDLSNSLASSIVHSLPEFEKGEWD